MVLYHLGGAFAAPKYLGQPFFEHLFLFGHAGVEFFFVLSGFIIFYVHQNDIGQLHLLPRYLKRRAIRIYPAYWIIFVGITSFAAAVPAFRESVPSTAAVLIKSLLLVPQDPALVGGTGAPVIIVAWSLQYEILFYSIFAVFIANAWAGAMLLGFLCVWWTLGGIAGTPEFPLSYMAPHFFAMFAIGICAACLTRNQVVQVPVLWVVAGLTIFTTTAALEVGGIGGAGLDRSPAISLGLRLSYGLASGCLVCGLVALEQKTRKSAPGLLQNSATRPMSFISCIIP